MLKLEGKVWSDIKGLNFNDPYVGNDGNIKYFKNRYRGLEFSGSELMNDTKRGDFNITINTSSPIEGEEELLEGSIWIKFNRNEALFLRNYIDSYLDMKNIK